jgi:hypothetical protein
MGGEPRQSAEPVPAEVAGLRKVLERARRGEVASLPELRAVLRSRPDLVEYGGNLAAIAERAWIGVAAGPDLAVAESLKLKAAELRAELSGPCPTPLERLAIDRVVVSWLECSYADVVAARLCDVSPRVAEFALERQDRAAKRHLSSLGALATIRKLTPDLNDAAPEGDRRRPGRIGSLRATIDPDPDQARPDAVIPALSVIHPKDPDATGPAGIPR